MQLICKTGAAAKALRKELGLSQANFWAAVAVTQSGGCRYERGRGLPRQTALLLHLVFGSDKQAAALLAELRS